MTTNTEATSPAPTTAPRKWSACPDDRPGKIQVGRFNKALRKLSGAGTPVELHGVKGMPERDTFQTRMSMMAERTTDAAQAMQSVAERHDWTLTRKNTPTICKELAAAYLVVHDTREIVDCRLTRKDHDARTKKAADAMAKHAAEREAANALRDANTAPIMAKKPAGAQAIIVAELIQDQSDSQTDYYGSSTVRTVAIGWRTGSREDFKQLRRAAATFEPTAHLETAEDAEHRENYSMGAGNYLKASHRYASGWQVVSRSYGGNLPPGIEDAIPDAAAPQSGDGYTLQESENKKGAFWLVVPTVRSDRTTFEGQRASAKAAGGWYSRKWGQTPGGFGFDFADKAGAESWANENLAAGNTPEPSPDGGREREATRLGALADSMTDNIADKRAPLSQNWTARRAGIKDGQRADADRLEETQKGLRAIAAALRANALPCMLASLATRKAVSDALHVYNPKGAAKARGDQLRALIETYATVADAEEKAGREKADELRTLEDGARTMRVPGFFPTPAPVVARMLAAAGIDTTAPRASYFPRYNFLEPSAGIGSIATELAGYVEKHGGTLDAVEINSSLCEILRAKGIAPHCADFLEWKKPDGMPLNYDRILINPPFEKGQDERHVARALSHLRPGGRLVGLMTPRGAMSYVQEPPEGFTVKAERLPEGSFAGVDAFRATGVSVVMVTIDRDELND